MQSLATTLRGSAAFQRLVSADADTAPIEEPAPTCGRCQDRHYVKRKVDLGHPDFGRAFPCPDCYEPVIRQQRLDRIFGQLPPIYRGITLDSCDAFLAGRAALGQVVEPRDLVERLRAWLRTDRWLWLYGPVGLAKTSLAIALLRAEVEAGKSGIYRTVPRLLERLKQTFDDSESDTFEAVFGELVAVDVLLLDDLGKQHTTSWARQQLFDLVNERYLAGRRTLVTSNKPWWEVAEDLNDPAVPDRIRERAGEYVIEVRGESLRVPA